tara:strand:+ start:4624 stop:5064 length:441 start_codon:yes stop_codon:yes gene_type:complete
VAHLRQSIRERIATVVTGLSTTGSNVFQTRIYPIESGTLPCLLIYTTSEESEIDQMASPRPMIRSLNVVIQGVVSATQPDDTLDLISKEVEIAMANDVTINSLANNSFLSSTEIEINSDGAKPVGILMLNYTVEYRNLDNNPETAI